jgi:hypothetical protein
MSFLALGYRSHNGTSRSVECCGNRSVEGMDPETEGIGGSCIHAVCSPRCRKNGSSGISVVAAFSNTGSNGENDTNPNA